MGTDMAWLHPRDQLVSIMNRIYEGGMTTLSGGNLSIKEANGDLWITPAGVDKGSLMPQDIVCVHEDGSVSGKHRPSSEYPFHKAIYARQPDLRAVVHAHPPALVAFSIARVVPDTTIIPQAGRICGPVGYAPYALPGSEALGESIAATFGDHNVVLLENHGVATDGETLLGAFQRLETLDFCARSLIRAKRLGVVSTLSQADLAAQEESGHLLEAFVPEGHSSLELGRRQEVITFLRRACKRQLMMSTEGVISARVDETSFVITPTGHDRFSLGANDLVLVQDDKREADKAPSRSVRLHSSIYARHPNIHSVMTAQCPNILAHAITGASFDSKTIPESYILLREVPTVPFGAQYRQPERIAAQVSSQHPVILIQNDCVLTVGRSVLEAFDRLEVAEFSAGALIDTAAIGPLVLIGPQEIVALTRKFLAGD